MAVFSVSIVILLIFEVTLFPRIQGIDDEGSEDPNMDDSLELEDDNMCSGETYMMIDSLTTCCNHSIILKHGIEYAKFWKECAVKQKPTTGQSKDKKKTVTESYVNSTRRVYACIVQKYAKKSTVSMVDFAQLMTINYPSLVKSKIMDQAKNHALQKKKETPIINYNGMRRIRNEFFKIQKSVCISLDPSYEKPENSEAPVDNKLCDTYEESEKNGGNCCKNQSIPLDMDYWHVPSEQKNFCNNTMAEFFKKWKIQDSQIDAALEICSEACRLNQEGVITKEGLEKMKLKTKKDFSTQIRLIAPPYLPATVLQHLQTYAASHNNTSSFEDYYAKMFQLLNTTAAALRPCILVQRLTEMMNDGLYSYCSPELASDRPEVKH